jgi:16S rRNA (guanine966-N2)-methyltransferase
MRIIAGQWRGRKLVAPAGDATRPTADRTRETLFSMLVSRIGSFEGLAVADLFAGSGALGLEACRAGQETCLFVEQDAAAIRALRANIAACAPSRNATCAPLRCCRWAGQGPARPDPARSALWQRRGFRGA